MQSELVQTPFTLETDCSESGNTIMMLPLSPSTKVKAESIGASAEAKANETIKVGIMSSTANGLALKDLIVGALVDLIVGALVDLIVGAFVDLMVGAFVDLMVGAFVDLICKILRSTLLPPS